jgi:hypothetical protein
MDEGDDVFCKPKRKKDDDEDEEVEERARKKRTPRKADLFLTKVQPLCCCCLNFSSYICFDTRQRRCVLKQNSVSNA